MKTNKILLRYTALTLFIVILAVVNGLYFIRKISDRMIFFHLNSYQDVISYSLDHDAKLRLFFENDNFDKNGNSLNSLAEKLYTKGVFRIVIWNHNGRAIWSDTETNEENSVYDSEKYQKAIKGNIVYKLNDTDNTSPANNPKGGWVLDAFIPVNNSNNIIGVVEIHQHVRELANAINDTTIKLWIIIIVTAILLYLLLFLVFNKVNKNQKIMFERLILTQDSIIFALAYQAELRDQETGGHLERVSSYVRLLVEPLSRKEKYKDYLSEDYINDLIRASHLHDIGKVGIPDAILKKPGKVTDEEFEVIKKHCEYGVNVLEKALSRLSIQSFLDIAVQLVGCHHEKWDGTGYPNGLKDEEIPLSGRIMALADVYDALRSDRVYKEAFSHEECVRIISELSGTHFDPEIVNIFLANEKEFLKISESM